MNFFFKMKENRFFISLGDCFCRLLSPWTPLAVLLIIAMYVMFGEYKYISELLGVSNKEAPKNEVLKIIGILMGGILVVWQAWASHKRAKAMEGTAKAQADAANAQADAAQAQARANENTEQGLRQERLKNAIEHLGDKKDSVRLGGAYEIFHLAEDTEELRQTVLDILCAHIRQTTGEKEYQEKHKSKPTEEVQSILSLLFVQEHEVFKGLRIELQESWLKGADLKQARLKGAILNKAYLQGADLVLTHLERAMLVEAHLEEAILVGARLEKARLEQAYLQGADLAQAYLQEAFLSKAHLQGADLAQAYLQEAFLSEAHLQGAKLRRARLQGAKLRGAHLEGAKLHYARLQGAFLFEARLQGAILGNACLQGADLSEAYLQGANLRNAKLQGANLRNAKLQGAILGNAKLQGANLEKACLQGADLEKACLQGAGKVGWSSYMSFGDRIQTQKGEKTDLSDAIFAGGLSEKDVDALVEGLSKEKVKEMREKLKPHIGPPEIIKRSEESKIFPESTIIAKKRGAITGSYTERDVEQWITD